jgi:hypothetical protein
MYEGTLGALGYQTVNGWIDGAFYSCTTAQVNTCQLGDNVNPKVIAWASKGSGTFVVPAAANWTCNALNQCLPVAPGTTVTIGNMPQWFGIAPA